MIGIDNLLVDICTRYLLRSVFVFTGSLLIGHVPIGRVVWFLIFIVASLILKGWEPHSDFVFVLLVISATHVLAKLGLIEALANFSWLDG